MRTPQGLQPACRATLRTQGGTPQRLIHALHLSRPENYLSIYQSGCNMACRKCHSWEFSQSAQGTWMSPEEIVDKAVTYDRMVTLREPRHRATAWHAQESCRCCGSCITYGIPSEDCPRMLAPSQILLSPQGYGPARNIVAFTGGDLTCRPAFYCRCTEGIKERTRLWVLIETNGYGLTPRHLDRYRQSGVDAFWLDIKAFDGAKHRWLTGCDNGRILRLPEEILSRGFVLEVLSLLIPGVVGVHEIGQIASLLAATDPSLPFTILAFFPQHKLAHARSPTVLEMVSAYEEAKARGMQNVRLGNLGVFIQDQRDWDFLRARVDPRGR